MPEDADLDLARAAHGGSREAFGELTLRHYPAVHRFLISLLANPSDAEDLTQDTFIRAFAKIHSYRPGHPFRPWLFAIARRLAIAHWRRSRPTDPLDEQTPMPAVEDEACLHDAAVLWETARCHLKAEEFSALWFFYREDLPVRELAKVLGKTTTHTKVILHRARKRLHESLTGELRDTVALTPNAIQSPS